MRRPSWFDVGEESLARRLALLPLDLLALAYGVGACAHRTSYTRGLLRPVQLSCRVVSVGNLVVGGSGKTPMAAWLAKELHQRGHRVVLASRGYARRGRERVEVVSDGRFVSSTADAAGDEPILLAAHAPGVPVLVGPDRDVVGMRAVSAFGAQILVLDDGFHHHRLARDLDLVCFDGNAGLGNRRVLPRGPLREFPSVLRLADALAVIDGPLSEADQALLERFAPAARRFVANRRPVAVRRLAGGDCAPPQSLEGLEVGLLSGIARPDSFRRTVESLGARVIRERRFHDHHRYRERDLYSLEKDAPVWLTTEKDAVKILPSWVGSADVRVVSIEVVVEDADRLGDWLEDRLREQPIGRDAALPAAAEAPSVPR
jgi:tetraacyldisaccharide 4'-kinase